MIQLKTPRLRNHTTSKFRIVFLKYDDEGHYQVTDMYSSNQIEDLYNLEGVPSLDCAVVTNLYSTINQSELFVGLTVQARRRKAILQEIKNAKSVIKHWEDLR